MRNTNCIQFVTLKVLGERLDGGVQMINERFVRDKDGEVLVVTDISGEPYHMAIINKDGSVTEVSRYRGKPSTVPLEESLAPYGRERGFVYCRLRPKD